MARSFTSASLSRVARGSALALGCLALAHCSGSSKYGERVAAEGEPVPKGGGSFRIGKPYSINGRTYVPNDNSSYRAEGIASWYGPDFHGRLTANGELYDMHAISAAHTTMPLPSYARVTNLDNGRSIIVRVNDRGPYVRNRIIDLSIGTAKALDFYGHGLARVRVEYVGRAPLEGSDDAMLLATLREGFSAPAPSKVMIASAKPFLPKVDNGKDAPLPSGRAFSPDTSTRSPEQTSANQKSPGQKSAGEVIPTSRSQTRSRSASADPRLELPQPTNSTTAMPREVPTLGLMSGRGLY
jgi:peptidoglycan lytic transglycosylase